MNKNITAVVVLLLVLAGLAGYAFTHKPQPEPQKPLGALSSPDISSPYLSFGGVRSWAAAVDLRQGSTTLCAIQSPAATTTLVSATIRVNFASTSATYIEIGRATTAFATTTGMGTLPIAANAGATLIASSTGNGTLYQTEIAPSTWVNVKAAFDLAASSATVPTGRCNVVFREI